MLQTTAKTMLTTHENKWTKVVNKFTCNSIETRQAMILRKIEELQNKKKQLEELLTHKHRRSAKSLDIDARIRASSSQNYFIVADHYQQISRSLERIESQEREFNRIGRIQNFVKKNTGLIESKCRVFDSKVLGVITDLVLREQEEKELILKRVAVQRRKSLGKIVGQF